MTIRAVSSAGRRLISRTASVSASVASRSAANQKGGAVSPASAVNSTVVGRSADADRPAANRSTSPRIDSTSEADTFTGSTPISNATAGLLPSHTSNDIRPACEPVRTGPWSTRPPSAEARLAVTTGSR